MCPWRRKSGSIMLGVQSVCRDYGREVSITMGSDSSVVKDVLDGSCLGRIEHLEGRFLWI